MNFHGSFVNKPRLGSNHNKCGAASHDPILVLRPNVTMGEQQTPHLSVSAQI